MSITLRRNFQPFKISQFHCPVDVADNFPPSETPPKALLAKEVKVEKTKPSLSSIYEQMRERQKREERIDATKENIDSSSDSEVSEDDVSDDTSDVTDYDL